MPTTYLQLLSGAATGDALSAANWNKAAGAVDRDALALYSLLGNGVKTGWTLTSSASTVAAGTGYVGTCWCATAAVQAVSGLLSGSTNYVYAKTDAGSPASGTLDFVARATSAGVTNYDGVTAAVYLGKATFATGTGFATATTTNRGTWSIDHGGLTGKADNDHPEYMRPIQVLLHGKDALVPATSAAATSTYGTSAPVTVVKFAEGSTTRAHWPFLCPADYSGTITLYTDWVSSGTAGNTRLAFLTRNLSSGEALNGALASCCAITNVAISGTAGHLRRTSVAWTSNKPTASERCTIVVRRDGANASDTCSGVARLVAVHVKLNTAR